MRRNPDGSLSSARASRAHPDLNHSTTQALTMDCGARIPMYRWDLSKDWFLPARLWLRKNKVMAGATPANPPQPASGEGLAKPGLTATYESSGDGRRRVHLRLPRGRAPGGGLRGCRGRQLQQVRTGQAVVRQRPPLSARRG